MSGSRHAQSRRTSRRVALCAMISSLSAVLMLSGGVIPAATFAAPLLAGLLLLVTMLETDRRAAWAVWAVTAVLTLLLSSDKEAACFYLFVGWWPMVKWPLERRIGRPWMRLAVKALLFAALLAAMYALLTLILGAAALLGEFREMGRWMTAAFFVGMLGCLLLWDRLLMPMAVLYTQRLAPRLKFLRR